MGRMDKISSYVYYLEEYVFCDILEFCIIMWQSIPEFNLSVETFYRMSGMWQIVYLLTFPLFTI